MPDFQRANLVKAFGILWLLLIPAAIAIMWADLQLRTDEAPDGIISFELCHFSNSCQTILDSWDAKAQLYAMFSLGFDYLFMLLYPGLIAVGLLLLAANHAEPSKRRLTLLAYSCVIMSLGDAIENYGLIQILLGNSIETYGPIAAWFATAKFAVLAVSLPAVLGFFLLGLISKK
jgi:hypothetical protein